MMKKITNKYGAKISPNETIPLGGPHQTSEVC